MKDKTNYERKRMGERGKKAEEGEIWRKDRERDGERQGK